MEGPDHVLPARMVNGSFSADRRIDLSEERSGNLDVIDAALVARGCKSCDVSDNATA